MVKPIALIGIAGSALVGEMAERLAAGRVPHHVLSLDAPLEGKAVTVAPAAVVWEGVDLLEMGAIFVERPVFPWPQMLLPFEPFHFDFTSEEWGVFQREAGALIVSALRAVAECRRVINPPAAVHLAVSPSIALDRCARNGVPVHPWRLEPAPACDQQDDGFVLDACWRERWHSPRRPPAGESALVLEAFTEEVVTVMVVGGRPAGALHYSSGASWARRHAAVRCSEEERADDDRPDVLDSVQSYEGAAACAVRAADVLELDYAAVSVRGGDDAASVVLYEAGPDCEAWNRFLEGRLAGVLADHLISAASR